MCPDPQLCPGLAHTALIHRPSCYRAPHTHRWLPGAGQTPQPTPGLPKQPELPLPGVSVQPDVPGIPDVGRCWCRDARGLGGVGNAALASWPEEAGDIQESREMEGKNKAMRQQELNPVKSRSFPVLPDTAIKNPRGKSLHYAVPKLLVKLEDKGHCTGDRSSETRAAHTGCAQNYTFRQSAGKQFFIHIFLLSSRGRRK